MEWGPYVLWTLKIAVMAVTLLLLSALVALWRGNVRLHGRLNLTFFTLTLITVLGFELLIRVIQPDVFEYFKKDAHLVQMLNVHLCFSVPSAVVMPLMVYTGLTHKRRAHLTLAVVFSVLWTGTFITGVFFLPTTLP